MKDSILIKVRSMIFNRRLWEKRSIPSLYDSIKVLPVETFFKILETNNLSLLNPKNKRVKEQRLRSLWESIREEYYKESNPAQYKVDLNKAKRIDRLNTEIIGCTSAILYFEMTGEIHEAFKVFGYTVKNSEDVARVKRKMLVRKTKLVLLTPSQKDKDKKDKKEAIRFWDIVSDVQTTMNQLNILSGEINIKETTVEKWISYINSIRKANKRNGINKQKGNR